MADDDEEEKAELDAERIKKSEEIEQVQEKQKERGLLRNLFGSMFSRKDVENMTGDEMKDNSKEVKNAQKPGRIVKEKMDNSTHRYLGFLRPEKV